VEENFAFVTLENGRVVTQHSPLQGHTIEALTDMHSQIPGGLTAIGVAAVDLVGDEVGVSFRSLKVLHGHSVQPPGTGAADRDGLGLVRP